MVGQPVPPSGVELNRGKVPRRDSPFGSRSWRRRTTRSARQGWTGRRGKVSGCRPGRRWTAATAPRPPEIVPGEAQLVRTVVLVRHEVRSSSGPTPGTLGDAARDDDPLVRRELAGLDLGCRGVVAEHRPNVNQGDQRAPGGDDPGGRADAGGSAGRAGPPERTGEVRLDERGVGAREVRRDGGCTAGARRSRSRPPARLAEPRHAFVPDAVQADAGRSRAQRRTPCCRAMKSTVRLGGARARSRPWLLPGAERRPGGHRRRRGWREAAAWRAGARSVSVPFTISTASPARPTISLAQSRRGSRRRH